MRITYDKSANAAYIYLTQIPPGGVANSVVSDDDAAAGVVLDFDSSGKLIGIEILNATENLPKGLLDVAEIIG